MMKMPDFLAAEPGGEFHIIEAAEKAVDLKNITGGIAYSGGKIRQWWSDIPVVVDIAGMTLAAQVPLLYNHINDPHYRLGELQIAKTADKIAVSGGSIHQETDLAREIVAQGKKYDWQLSIGGAPQATETVPEGETRFVNGREQSGPFNCITKSTLREVSVVAVGADSDTHLKIAASFGLSINHNQTQGTAMDPKLKAYLLAKFTLGADVTDDAIKAHLKSLNLTMEAMDREYKAIAAVLAPSAVAPTAESGKTAPAVAAQPVVAAAAVPAVVASANPTPVASAVSQEQIAAAVQVELGKAREQENQRVAAINVETTDYPELRAVAINGGWTVDAVKQTITGIKAVQEKRPQHGGNIIVKTGSEINRNVLEAALCLRENLGEESLLKAYGEQTLTAADDMRDLSLRDLVVICARMEGKPVGVGFNNDSIRAGFSTVSLPGILSNVANKVLRQSYDIQPVIATKLCSEGDLNDFKVSERYRMTDIGELKQIGADGEFKEGGLSEDKATNQLETYGKKITLTRKMIVNDDLNAFTAIPRSMGNKAARMIDKLFFTRLLANPNQNDGKALFSTNHKNFLSGATSAFSKDALAALLKLFLDQVDADNEPIVVEPKFLLVPTALYEDAIELTKSQVVVIAGGATSTVRPAMNGISLKNLEVVSAPHLGNKKFDGYSDTGFYLFGDPKQIDTFEIGYLKGRRAPTVETGAVDFDVLGISYRVYFDVGVKEQDFRGMTFSQGKA